MSRRVLTAIQRALFPRWNSRLEGVLSRGRRMLNRGMTADEAYVEGYRDAYFDAVADLVEEGLIEAPAATQPPAPHRPLTDEIH